MKKNLKMFLIAAAVSLGGIILSNCNTCPFLGGTSDVPSDAIPAESLYAVKFDAKAYQKTMLKIADESHEGAGKVIEEAFQQFVKEMRGVAAKKGFDCELLGQIMESKYYAMHIPLKMDVRVINEQAETARQERDAKLKSIQEEVKNDTDADSEVEDDDLFSDDADLPQVGSKVAAVYTGTHTIVIETDSCIYPKSAVKALLPYITQKMNTEFPDENSTFRKVQKNGVEWYELVSDTPYTCRLENNELLIRRTNSSEAVYTVCAYQNYLIISQFTPMPFIQTLTAMPNRSFSDLGLVISKDASSYGAVNVQALLEPFEEELKATLEETKEAQKSGDIAAMMSASIAEYQLKGLEVFKKAFGLEHFVGATYELSDDMESQAFKLVFDDDLAAGAKCLLDPNLEFVPPDFINADSVISMMQTVNYSGLVNAVVDALPADIRKHYDSANQSFQEKTKLSIEDAVGLFAGDAYLFVTPESKVFGCFRMTDSEKVESLVAELAGDGKTERINNAVIIGSSIVLRGHYLFFGDPEIISSVPFLVTLPECQRLSRITACNEGANSLVYYPSVAVAAMLDAQSGNTKTDIYTMIPTIIKEADFSEMPEGEIVHGALISLLDKLMPELKKVSQGYIKNHSENFIAIGTFKDGVYTFRYQKEEDQD